MFQSLRFRCAARVYLCYLLLHSSVHHFGKCQQPVSTSAGVFSGSQPDSCGYGMIAPSIFPNGHLATLDKGSPILAGLPQGGCGACIQVTCTDPAAGVCNSGSPPKTLQGVCNSGSPPVTVQIVDTSSSLQLSSADMATLSSQGNRLGHVGVSIQQVNCPATGSIVVRLQQMTPVANGYAKLALLNVAGSNGITSVAVAPVGSQNAAQLKNTYGAVWEGSLPTAPPLDLILSDGSQQLLLSNVITSSTAPGDIMTSMQFTAAGNLVSAAPSASAAATGAVGRSLLANAAFQALQDYVEHQAAGAASPSPAVTLTPVPSPTTPPSPNVTASPSLGANLTTMPSPVQSPSPTPSAIPSPSANNNNNTTSSPPATPEQSPSPLMTPTASPAQSPSPVTNSGALPGAAPPSPAPASQEPLPATAPTGPLFNLAAAAAQKSCPTIFETLQLSPDLTSWVDLIQGKGLQNNLNGNNQGITMFAPINDAFSEPLLAGISGLDGAQTILDLTNSIPDVISDLLGYSVVPQQLQQNQLQAGEMFNTTNVVKTGSGVNGVPAYIPIEIKTTNTMTQVEGVGSISTILQPNIQACGSVIHLVSNALLPFNVRTFNLPTQTPSNPATEMSPAGTSPVSPGASPTSPAGASPNSPASLAAASPVSPADTPSTAVSG